jgi:hypothetical protein
MALLLKKNDKYYIGDDEIYIKKLCGKGSYGMVYKCKYLDRSYVIKFSKNENPDILKKRYDILKNICVKHVIFGNVLDDEYLYFSIMKNGGVPLRKYKIDESNFNIINKQLYDIVEYIKNKKIMYADFKMANIVVKNNVVKLIDIYMDCYDCNTNMKCKIVRTISTVDLSLKLHENPDYNYSYIYALYGFLLLELTNNNLSQLCKKFNKENNCELETKKIAYLFQLSLLYENMDFYKKYITEQLYDCLNSNKKYLSKIYHFIFNNIQSSIPDFNKKIFNLIIPISEMRQNIII